MAVSPTKGVFARKVASKSAVTLSPSKKPQSQPEPRTGEKRLLQNDPLQPRKRHSPVRTPSPTDAIDETISAEQVPQAIVSIRMQLATCEEQLRLCEGRLVDRIDLYPAIREHKQDKIKRLRVKQQTLLARLKQLEALNIPKPADPETTALAEAVKNLEVKLAQQENERQELMKEISVLKNHTSTAADKSASDRKDSATRVAALEKGLAAVKLEVASQKTPLEVMKIKTSLHVQEKQLSVVQTSIEQSKKEATAQSTALTSFAAKHDQVIATFKDDMNTKIISIEQALKALQEQAQKHAAAQMTKPSVSQEAIDSVKSALTESMKEKLLQVHTDWERRDGLVAGEIETLRVKMDTDFEQALQRIESVSQRLAGSDRKLDTANTAITDVSTRVEALRATVQKPLFPGPPQEAPSTAHAHVPDMSVARIPPSATVFGQPTPAGTPTMVTTAANLTAVDVVKQFTHLRNGYDVLHLVTDELQKKINSLSIQEIQRKHSAILQPMQAQVNQLAAWHQSLGVALQNRDIQVNTSIQKSKAEAIQEASRVVNYLTDNMAQNANKINAQLSEQRKQIEHVLSLSQTALGQADKVMVKAEELCLKVNADASKADSEIARVHKKIQEAESAIKEALDNIKRDQGIMEEEVAIEVGMLQAKVCSLCAFVGHAKIDWDKERCMETKAGAGELTVT